MEETGIRLALPAFVSIFFLHPNRFYIRRFGSVGVSIHWYTVGRLRIVRFRHLVLEKMDGFFFPAHGFLCRALLGYGIVALCWTRPFAFALSTSTTSPCFSRLSVEFSILTLPLPLLVNPV